MRWNQFESNFLSRLAIFWSDSLYHYYFIDDHRSLYILQKYGYILHQVALFLLQSLWLNGTKATVISSRFSYELHVQSMLMPFIPLFRVSSLHIHWWLYLCASKVVLLDLLNTLVWKFIRSKFRIVTVNILARIKRPLSSKCSQQNFMSSIWNRDSHLWSLQLPRFWNRHWLK